MNNKLTSISNIKLAIIGMGYVGLPLAVEFGRNLPVIGFDINQRRIEELRKGKDSTLETTKEQLTAAKMLNYTSDSEYLRTCNCFIVTVPTPIDEYKRPDLIPLIKASETIGKVLKKGDIVIYESTVYPGCTEEICVPKLEEISGLRFNRDFYCGYSPERINPGDKEHRLTTIKKVTSGSTPKIADFIDDLYKSVVIAGTHKAPSIKVAEAAKVIENTQRDLNIALMNELAIIFNKIGIDTLEVLEAAGTKWNFLNFRPGLVGGHCIGVDPYYLTYKAEMLGYHPEVILAGRRINDGMSNFIAQQTIKQMIQAGKSIKGDKIIILGLTFKENCPDLRNSKVADIISELEDYGCDVLIHDPIANSSDAKHEYGIKLTSWNELPEADAIVLAVPHSYYLDIPKQTMLSILKSNSIFIDVKSAFSTKEFSKQNNKNIKFWRL
jgi:UDP-N-acetyl-D-galactosamine dehydrogenase